MATRDQIVEEARTWIGTRWQHQARLKGIAVDCAGLVIGVGKTFDLMPQDYDYRGYGREPDKSLETICQAELREIAIKDLQPGDVISLNYDPTMGPSHLALIGNYRYGGFSIIHAYLPARKVVETRLDSSVASRISKAFSYKGVK